MAQFVVHVNFVQVPVTVKDSKGNLVSGLTWRDFTVYENNTREPLRVFSVDPQPLSIAFVIDQTLPSNIMAQVNQSMGSIQGALAPYDEAAVFTYTNGAKEWTGFTGAQSARLPAVLSLAQTTGTDPMVPDQSWSACRLRDLHQRQLRRSRTCSQASRPRRRQFITIPKEIHTLNDAILAAAKELSTRPKDRRRIIYVISDGKEYGSKASWKEVVRYLQTNKIAVYATLVGDSARWGEEWLDRFHLPFTCTTTSCTSTPPRPAAILRRGRRERHREELRQDRRRGPQPVHAGLPEPRVDLRRQVPHHRCARRPAQRDRDRQARLLSLRAGLQVTAVAAFFSLKT